MGEKSSLIEPFCRAMNKHLNGGAVRLVYGPAKQPVIAVDCTFSNDEVRVLMNESIGAWMDRIDWSSVEAGVGATRRAEIQQAWEQHKVKESTSLNSIARDVVFPLRAFGGGAKNLTTRKISLSAWANFKLDASHVEAAFGKVVLDRIPSSGRSGWCSLEDVRNEAGALGIIVPDAQSAAPETQTDVNPTPSEPQTGNAALPKLPPLNLLLEGVPGVGETFRIAEIVAKIGPTVRGHGRGRFAITMHPATTYEDFVEGLRPASGAPSQEERNTDWCSNGGHAPQTVPVSGSDAWFWNAPAGKPDKDARFTVQDGFFLRVCAEAVHFPNHYFVVLLDEFNRCNIPKVLGDLLTSIEASKRARWTGEAWDVTDCPRPSLPGSKRLFFVPDNVIVVATMNTSDRSVGGLDAALRRRFAFERVWPHGFDPKQPCDPTGVLDQVLEKESKNASTLTGEPLDLLRKTVEVWHTLNAKLKQLGPDALLGHSYLYDLRKALENGAAADTANRDRRFALGTADQAVEHVWLQQLLPQLCEILDVHHHQRADDLAPYNALIAGLGLGVSLAPPNGRSVHGAVHLEHAS